ncbi:MAG: DsbA family oxidoreductase [Actinomycetota bacterium]
MVIEIWSDVVCPWCYIGKVRFDRALSALTTGPDAVTEPIEVVYRAYQLDPTAPIGTSNPVRDTYAKKFGGYERADRIIENLTATARADEIEFRMDIAKRANTLLAHRVLWWTGATHGGEVQARVKAAFLDAYFTRGLDVADADVLATLAAEVIGCDTSVVSDVLSSDIGRGEVSEELAMAIGHGITGVPTYVIDGAWAIPGAQDTETFERVIRRAIERRTPETN